MIQFNFVLFSFHFQFVWSERNWPVEDKMKERSFFSSLFRFSRLERSSPSRAQIASPFPPRLRTFCESAMNLDVSADSWWHADHWHDSPSFHSRLARVKIFQFSLHSKSRLWSLINERLPIFPRRTLIDKLWCFHFLLPCHLWRLSQSRSFNKLSAEWRRIDQRAESRREKKSCLHNIKHQASQDYDAFKIAGRLIFPHFTFRLAGEAPPKRKKASPDFDPRLCAVSFWLLYFASLLSSNHNETLWSAWDFHSVTENRI